MELIELEHSKAKRAKVIATKEVEEYESLGKDIEAKIVETKQDIELLKKVRDASFVLGLCSNMHRNCARRSMFDNAERSVKRWQRRSMA